MEDKINILMITVRADYGGGPEHLFKLITNLTSEVNIFIAAPMDDPYYSKYKNIVGDENIIIIPHRKFSAAALFRLIKFIKLRDISIVHSHGKGAGLYSRLLSAVTGVKCIHTFHGIHILQYSKLAAWLYIKLEQLLSIFTSRAIVVSKGEHDVVVNLSMIPNSKISIIENGVDFPDRILDDNNFCKPYKILTVTRFDFSKNTELILDIASKINLMDKLADYEFHFVGSGEQESSVKQKSVDLGLSQHFVFHGFQKDMAPYYLSATIFLSTSRWEGMPLSVLEAMSFGLPVIATNVRGNNDAVIHNMTGYLYDIENPEQAAQYIIRIFEDLERWRLFSSESRERIKNNFTVQRMANKTEKLYYCTADKLINS